MTLKEEVEQFVFEFLMADGVTEEVDAKSNLYALLRRVVEECCDSECEECKSDEGVSGPDFEGIYWHLAEPEAGGSNVCKANRIRQHFSWLFNDRPGG